MDLRKFLAELKRRNVYRVGVAYVVVAWLLIQVATQIFPFFDIPNWAVRLVVLLLALGFPVTLIMAWAFELTPEGLKRTDEVPVQQSIARSTRRKLDYAIIAVLAAAVGLLLFDRFRAKPAVAPASDSLAKSIAVLPFESLSEDKENAYFAVGVQDEILTRLAKVADLKVISRTSTQQYQSNPGNIAEIARQLGVGHILEGSVQKAGEEVRVNVQLIKADTDAHLWAETYDSDIANVFQVQSDIALQIAAALEAKLTGREKHEIGAGGTTNPEAYDAYLRGLALDSAQSGDDVKMSLESFRRAVELDPNFALAWAALTNREAFKYFSNRTAEQLDRARHAMEMALKLAPEASESLAAAGSFYYYCPQDFDRALDYLGRARKGAPSNPFVIMMTSAVKRRQGKLEEAIELLRKASTLDPRNNDLWVNLARTHRGMRNFAAAHRMFDQALTVTPREIAILSEKAEAYTAAGDLASAARVLQPLPVDARAESFRAQWGLEILQRHFDRALEMLTEAIYLETAPEERMWRQLDLAYLQAHTGNMEAARPVFEAVFGHIAELRAQGDKSLHLRDDQLRIAALLGDRDTVDREGKALLADTARDRWRYPQSESSVASAYALLGDADAAMPHIEGALAPSQQGLTPAYLRLDPVWDNVRQDPRFQRLAANPPR